MSTILLQPSPIRLPISAPRQETRAVASSPYTLGFVLFIVLNFVLFVRPTEVFEPLLGLEVYLVTILLCLAASFPAVLAQLRPSALDRNPLTLCVIGFNVAVVLSHLIAMRFELAGQFGFDFFKVSLYYLLLVGLVLDTRRLRTLLWWLTLFITLSTALMVLQFYDVIQLPVQAKIKDDVFLRLRATGIFSDPNDLCVLLVAGLMLSAYWLTERRSGIWRLLWLGPIALMFYALLLTQSRGGLLALLVALAVLFRARFGGYFALLMAMIVLPALLILVGGRQASFATGEGTGQERIQIWSDGLQMFRGAPLFGIGRGQFQLEQGMAAHNSYLQALAELGVFGGMFFVGGFFFALVAMDSLTRGRRTITDPELGRLYPYAMASLAGYMAGMMSLTLTYLIPTFTMLGMAAVFLRLTPTDPPRQDAWRFDRRFLGGLLGYALAMLVGLMIFVRLTRA